MPGGAGGRAGSAAPGLSTGTLKRDAAKLRGLRGRRDLSGRRGEALSRTVGKDGGPRFRVRVLRAGGEVVKVKGSF